MAEPGPGQSTIRHRSNDCKRPVSLAGWATGMRGAVHAQAWRGETKRQGNKEAKQRARANAEWIGCGGKAEFMDKSRHVYSAFVPSFPVILFAFLLILYIFIHQLFLIFLLESSLPTMFDVPLIFWVFTILSSSNIHISIIYYLISDFLYNSRPPRQQRHIDPPIPKTLHFLLPLSTYATLRYFICSSFYSLSCYPHFVFVPPLAFQLSRSPPS